MNLALGFLTTGRPEEALAPARRARELQREYSASAFFYQAIALYELGRLDDAVSLLRDVELAWAPSAPRTTAALARLAASRATPPRKIVPPSSSSSSAVGCSHPNPRSPASPVRASPRGGFSAGEAGGIPPSRGGIPPR